MRGLPESLLLPVLLAALAPAQDRLTPEGLWALRRVGEPALSPDGKQLAYTVRTTDLAANTGATQIWIAAVVDPAAARQVTTEGSNMSPMWSKDGAELAFVSTREGGAQIWIQPVAGGAARRVTNHPGGVENVHWSPDGSRFLFTAAVQVDQTTAQRHPDLPKASARIYDDLMVRHWDEWKDGTYSHLLVVAAGGGDAVDLMAGERADTPLKPFGGAEQLAWSPDGQEICYTSKKVTDPEVSTDSSLWLVKATGGEAKNLTPGMNGYDQDPAWSPDGKWIAFVSMARPGFEADRARLMLHERASGKNRELLVDFDASAHGLCWTADSQSLWFTVETKGTTQVYKTQLADGKPVAVTSGRHQMDALQLAPDGRTAYALRASMERPPEVVRIDAEKGGAGEAVTDVNGPVFGKLAMPTVREEWFAATDGQQIHAWIVLPPGFDPARKYPMLLFCQGGPQSMVGQAFSFRWNFHLMAASGYVVAAVNRRGLPGFGQAWNDQISRDWGGQAMRDLLAVTDAMQARSYVDRARCAAVGASFGGFTVYWLMGNAGDRFACMISHCGVFNLESMYLATEELFFVDWDLGGPFWKSAANRELYAKFSPHRFVQNWKTPLLVIHGEKDYRVPYDQGLQAFTAAQLQGVPSRLVTFPEAGHWVLRPQDGVLWQREFFGWLDRWCKVRGS